MAISSITKQFVVKDQMAFEKMIQEPAKPTIYKVTQNMCSLDKGRKALERFVLR